MGVHFIQRTSVIPFKIPAKGIWSSWTIDVWKLPEWWRRKTWSVKSLSPLQTEFSSHRCMYSKWLKTQSENKNAHNCVLERFCDLGNCTTHTQRASVMHLKTWIKGQMLKPTMKFMSNFYRRYKWAFNTIVLPTRLSASLPPSDSILNQDRCRIVGLLH